MRDDKAMKENNTEMNTSSGEGRRALYEKQKALLETLLSHGAITRAQYEKSLGDLTEKMGFGRSDE